VKERGESVVMRCHPAVALAVVCVALCAQAVQQMVETLRDVSTMTATPADSLAVAAPQVPSKFEAYWYERFERACVPRHNLAIFPSTTVQECAEVCDADPSCVAFEYGVSHGGRGDYQPGDCQPQDAVDQLEACDGGNQNLDLYVRVGPAATEGTQAAPPFVGAISGALMVAQGAFDLSRRPDVTIALALATELADEARQEQSPWTHSLSEMTAAYASSPSGWLWTLDMYASAHLFEFFISNRWFMISQGSGVVIWALLYRMSAKEAPTPRGYAALFNATRDEGIGKYVMRVIQLRALPICDRGCLLDLAASLAALALLSARRGHAADTAKLMDAAQTMVQTVHFARLAELMTAASWKHHLTTLWGLLHCIADTPLLRGLQRRFELGHSIESPVGFYIPDPMPRCPKKDELAPLPSRVALMLYRMLEVVGTLLSWRGVRWFASHGTLLGAIRQGGIIPHDCDVDLTVPLADVHMLMDSELLRALKLNGYDLTMRPVQNLYAVYRQGTLTTPAPWYPQMYISVEPYLNIYILDSHGKEPEDPCTYVSNIDFHNGFALHNRDVFPTQVVRFGSSTVNAPANPKKYLSNMYDDDWPTNVRCRSALTDCSQFTTHRFEANSSMAVPTSPLPSVEFPDEAASEFLEFPINDFPHIKRERTQALARARRI